MNNRITFIGGGLAGGGQERALVNLANYCAKLGYEVSIVNLFKTEIFFDLHPAIKISWPTVDRAKTHRLLYALKLVSYIRKEVKKAKSDVVISYGFAIEGYDKCAGYWDKELNFHEGKFDSCEWMVDLVLKKNQVNA